MKGLASRLIARFLYGRCNVWGLLVVAPLILTNTASYAGGYHTFNDEGHLLVNNLKSILIAEHVCASIIDCQSQGGYAFMKPVKLGVKISVYGVKSDRITASLLQTCAAAFATRQLGQEMTVEIYNVSILERNSQSAFSKTPATFTLKLEKTNVDH